MNTKELNECREAFEKEYGPRNSFSWRDENGSYKVASLQLAWNLWQAAWNRRPAPALPVTGQDIEDRIATARTEALTTLTIQFEKVLCAKLGRDWTPSGMSAMTLVDELASKALPVTGQQGAAVLYVRQMDLDHNNGTIIASPHADDKWAVPLFLNAQQPTPAPAVDAASVPAGWQLVPITPTMDMIVDGFESTPAEGFCDIDVWDEYDAMSGCQQAAHRAKLCWAAMLAAAPKLVDAAVPCPICYDTGTTFGKRCECKGVPP